ncbi:MAG: hypothetical protein NVSMB14_00240 [Isosphaeraceae bacterium]
MMEAERNRANTRRPEPREPGLSGQNCGVRHGILVATASLVTIMGVFVGLNRLWKEWRDLERERGALRNSAYIGYVNIQPRAAGKSPPIDWYLEKGDSILLWSGWKPGIGHDWFHLKTGEIERSQLSGVYGKEVIPAIDRPLIEVGDGSRWRRLNADTKVVGVQLNGMDTVYPLLLLEKVDIVNDIVWDRPFLITFSPSARPGDAVEVFNPLVDGKRMTLGTSGYLLNGEPLLYDRATESLWIRDADGLKAVSGTLKGTVLKRIARPEIVDWDVWLASHPKSRLIVGAETIEYPAEPTARR